MLLIYAGLDGWTRMWATASRISSVRSTRCRTAALLGVCALVDIVTDLQCGGSAAPRLVLLTLSRCPFAGARHRWVVQSGAFALGQRRRRAYRRHASPEFALWARLAGQMCGSLGGTGGGRA